MKANSFTAKVGRVTLNGREIKNPALKLAVILFALALLTVILTAILAVFVPVFAALFLTLLTGFGLLMVGLTFAGMLAAVGHPLLRACGKRGFVQTEEQIEESSSGGTSAKTTTTSLTITTKGALEKL